MTRGAAALDTQPPYLLKVTRNRRKEEEMDEGQKNNGMPLIFKVFFLKKEEREGVGEQPLQLFFF